MTFDKFVEVTSGQYKIGDPPPYHSPSDVTGTLKLWWNESEWVIAETPDDATAILLAEGFHPGDVAGFPAWEEYTKSIPWREDESQPIADAPRKTPAELIAEHGRGFLGSSEQ